MAYAGHDFGHMTGDSVFADAVNSFDITSEFTNNEWYANQVDIYSDQLVAIEAIRLLIERLQARCDRCEEEIKLNDAEIEINTGEIYANQWDSLQNDADITTIELDIADLEDCLARQQVEEELNRGVLELYCHQHAYVTNIMPECIPILVPDTRLIYGYDYESGYQNWTVNQDW